MAPFLSAPPRPAARQRRSSTAGRNRFDTGWVGEGEVSLQARRRSPGLARLMPLGRAEGCALGAGGGSVRLSPPPPPPPPPAGVRGEGAARGARALPPPA